MKHPLIILLAIMLFQLNLFSSEKVIFLHIPKTGGVTVSSLLENEYHLDEIKNNLLIAYGNHTTYFQIKKNETQYKIITFLRNPIDRILSEQRYCIEKYKGRPDILKAHFLSLDGNPVDTASNIMCKLLSGLDPDDPSISIDTHLAHAKEALTNDLFFFGLTEKMDESIALLYSLLRWPLPEEIPVFNTTDGSDHVYSQELLDGIRERNWADMDLYEYALTLYEARKDQISLQEADFEDIPSFSDQIFYSFDQKLPSGYGWCRRAFFEDKTVYRWQSSQNRSAIDFYLNSHHSYILKASVFIQPKFITQFRLYVNDILVETKFKLNCVPTTLKFSWLNLSAYISPELLQQGKKTRVRFEMIPPDDPKLLDSYQKEVSNALSGPNYAVGKCAFKSITIIPN